MQVKEVKTFNSYDLNAVFFINDKVGYAVGGERYGIGILMKTIDGGNSWTSPDSIMPKACYASCFFSEQEGIVGGFDSHLTYTNDSAATFNDRVFISYLPVRAIKFKDRQSGVLAFGNGYGDGSIALTHDGGQSWTESSKYNHCFRAAAYTDDGTIFIAGYGTILVSQDGINYTVSKQYGDFYTDLHFINDNTGFAVGYQGEILRTDNKGAKWEVMKKTNNPFEQPDHLLAVHFYDATNGVAVGENGLMLHTSDGGNSWKRAKAFTEKSLRDVILLSGSSGVIVAEGGSVFLFNL